MSKSVTIRKRRPPLLAPIGSQFTTSPSTSCTSSSNPKSSIRAYEPRRTAASLLSSRLKTLTRHRPRHRDRRRATASSTTSMCSRPISPSSTRTRSSTPASPTCIPATRASLSACVCHYIIFPFLECQ